MRIGTMKEATSAPIQIRHAGAENLAIPFVNISSIKSKMRFNSHTVSK